MRATKFIGPILVLAQSTAAAAEGSVRATLPAEETTEARTVRLAQRDQDAEHVPAATSDAGSDSASTDDSSVDPELARAAAADAANRAEAGAATSTVTPAAAGVTKMNPDMSLILDLGGAWFSHANHYRQGGHSMSDNGLSVQGLEFAASAAVDPYFRFDSYFQLTDVEVEEAYFTTLALPWNLQARGGMMNAAFGRQNALHLHAWSFSNAPLSHTRFMSAEHFRGPGLELSVLVPLPWYLNVIGQVFGTTAGLGFNSASFGSSEARASGRIEGPRDFLYLGRLESFFELSSNWSLLVGVSEALGQSPFHHDGSSHLHGGDVYLKWRPISSGQGDLAVALTIEYVLRDSALETGRLRDHGGFVELAQHLSKRWVTAIRWDTTSIGRDTRHAVASAGVAGSQRRGSLSLTFLPSHFSKLRIQGDLGRDQDREGMRYALFLQAEVSAGEHGAHKF